MRTPGGDPKFHVKINFNDETTAKSEKKSVVDDCVIWNESFSLYVTVDFYFTLFHIAISALATSMARLLPSKYTRLIGFQHNFWAHSGKRSMIFWSPRIVQVCPLLNHSTELVTFDRSIVQFQYLWQGGSTILHHRTAICRTSGYCLRSIKCGSPDINYGIYREDRQQYILCTWSIGSSRRRLVIFFISFSNFRERHR